MLAVGLSERQHQQIPVSPDRIWDAVVWKLPERAHATRKAGDIGVGQMSPVRAHGDQVNRATGWRSVDSTFSFMPNADRITGVVAHHGEGPYWDSSNGRLLCVDLLAGVIVAVDDDGGAVRYDVPSPVVSVIRRRRAGGFVIATERGAMVSDDDFSAFEEIAEFSRDPRVRANDGGCDPLGNFIVGTMAFDERADGGAVFLLTPDHRVDEVLLEVSIPNGVQWSGDGSRAYFIDSPTRRIDAFDVDPWTGAWSGRRTHIRVDATAGFPDGMAIDEEGGLWVALWGGGAVNHYDLRGRLVETISVAGVSQVSSCAFGGTDRRTLYITTSRRGLADYREPDAGAVFAVATDVRGATPSDFDG